MNRQGQGVIKAKQKRRETVAWNISDLTLWERKRTQVVIGPGEVDLSGLRLVTCDWLVPRLVEKFLATRGDPVRHSGAFKRASDLSARAKKL